MVQHREQDPHEVDRPAGHAGGVGGGLLHLRHRRCPPRGGLLRVGQRRAAVVGRAELQGEREPDGAEPLRDDALAAEGLGTVEQVGRAFGEGLVDRCR